MKLQNLTVNVEPLDQESRNPSARYPEVPTQSTEQVATSKQVASGDHFHIARCVLQGGLDTRPIIPLTHVCKYWRDSIISAPENWTRISNGRRKLAELSLERAKAAPLDVSSCSTSERKRDFSTCLLPHAHSIVSLNCPLHAIEELTQALPNFPKSMPNLQSLTLTGHGLPRLSQSH
jgi:hypothetical protein